MTICVTSCGRSGTNVILETLSGNSKLLSSQPEENKTFFTSNIIFPSDYLTKCDTVYYSTSNLFNTMNINKQLKLVWTIRDPRDMILSKIYRGQIGQDNNSNIIADDATEIGCIDDIQYFFSVYKFAKKHFPNRCITIKLEDILLRQKKTTKKLCKKLDIEYEKDMLLFYTRMRNKYKQNRYGKKIDINQLYLWKNYNNIYNGFFNNNVYDIPSLFLQVLNVKDYFKYND